VGDPRELAQRLAHEARLEAHVRIAHVALDLGLRHERSDRVDHDEIDPAGAHEQIADLEGLLARCPAARRAASTSTPIARAYLMSSACSASMNAPRPRCLLHLADRVQGERRLAARLRSRRPR
jgi:hypothetical protein